MGKHRRGTLGNFPPLSDKKIPANVSSHQELCDLKGKKMASTQIGSPALCCSVWLIHNYGWNKEACLPIWEGGVEGKRGKNEQFNIWIEQRNFFPQGSCREEPWHTQSQNVDTVALVRTIRSPVGLLRLSLSSTRTACSQMMHHAVIFGGEKSISSPGRYLLFKVPL